MLRQGLRSLPIYPEERECTAPTAERILALFAGLQRHDLIQHGCVIHAFPPELNRLQRQLVKLLGLPSTLYPTTP